MNNYTVYLLREDIETDCGAMGIQVAGIFEWVYVTTMVRCSGASTERDSRVHMSS